MSCNCALLSTGGCKFRALKKMYFFLVAFFLFLKDVAVLVFGSSEARRTSTPPSGRGDEGHWRRRSLLLPTPHIFHIFDKFRKKKVYSSEIINSWRMKRQTILLGDLKQTQVNVRYNVARYPSSFEPVSRPSKPRQRITRGPARQFLIVSMPLT